MKKWLIWIVGPFLLAGCSQNQSYEPEEINPEIDVCEICNMSIMNEYFATEVVSTEGERYKFDDIGCMVEFLEKELVLDKEEVVKRYVRDIHSGEWIEIEQAYHAHDSDFWTPMANGVVSFKNKEEAQRFIAEEGKGVLYDYEQLLNHSWSWEQ